jgi:hypothetical protein
MRSDTSPERRAKATELFQEQEPELSDDAPLHSSTYLGWTLLLQMLI